MRPRGGGIGLAAARELSARVDEWIAITAPTADARARVRTWAGPAGIFFGEDGRLDADGLASFEESPGSRGSNAPPPSSVVSQLIDFDEAAGLSGRGAPSVSSLPDLAIVRALLCCGEDPWLCAPSAPPRPPNAPSELRNVARCLLAAWGGSPREPTAAARAAVARLSRPSPVRDPVADLDQLTAELASFSGGSPRPLPSTVAGAYAAAGCAAATFLVRSRPEVARAAASGDPGSGTRASLAARMNQLRGRRPSPADAAAAAALAIRERNL